VPPTDTKRVPVPQAAADLGIPRSYIEHWLKNGDLEAIRFGRQGWRLVRLADVRALITGTPPPPAEKVAACNSLPASSFGRR
jgi:excisionase family DNA binding protein